MKKIITFLFVIAILVLSSPGVFAQAGSVSLTVNGSFVNTYSTIAAAYAAITDATGGVLIELSSSYNGSSETFPINLISKAGANASNRITIRPASGATVVSTNITNANYLKINGGSFLTIDGRNGGTGTSKDWTIQVTQTGTSSSALYLLGDAQNNIIQYCKIQSGILSQTAGVVRFGSGTTVGVSNNKILNCDISDYFDGTTHNYPRTSLFSVGASASLINTNNEIGNCNFYNFANVSSAFGMYFTNFNSGWNIHDNSFYMTLATSLSSNNSWGALSVNGSTDALSFVNNFIGGNSPQCGGSMSLGGDCTLEPIKFGTVTTPSAKNTVTGNTIKNISFNRTNASSSTNRMINLAQGDFNDVTGNVIENISGTFSGASHTLRAIEVATITPTLLSISKNKITNPNTTGASAIDGIYIGGINATISNNMVSIGSGTSADATIRGIYIGNITTANTANVYFNTVNINGTVTSGSANTLALSRVITSVTGTVVFKDNILINTRSGGTGKHGGIVSSTSNLTSDYNDIYCGNSSTVGSVDGTNFTTFANWQLNSSQDANSTSAVVAFVSATDLHLTGASLGDYTNLSGTPIVEITTDIDGDTRLSPGNGPYKGADEASLPLPVELSSFTANNNGRNIELNWSTKTEKNSNRFDIERSLVLKGTWSTVGSVKAAVLSNSPKSYSYSDNKLQTGKYQYRLRMVDNDGSFAYSSVEAAEVAAPKEFSVSQNYPNPFNPSTTIAYQVPVDAKVILEVYNIAGQKVTELVNQDLSAGYYTANFGASKLSSGVYIYRVIAIDKASGNNFSSVKKMMLLK